MYNRIARWYHLSQRLYFWLKFGGEERFRMPFLQHLAILPGHQVLAISTGTADNFRLLPRHAHYTGVDLSLGILRQAQRHLKRWRRKATLVHCSGEALPFADNSFDVVFHCGGINYFNDKAAAINEMIRVAKPGTRLMIVDETDKLVREQYQKNPFIRNNFTDIGKVVAPVALLPPDMKAVQLTLECRGLMYCLLFVKP